MVSVNLWSRVGNKLYILLEEKEKVIDFDKFFAAKNDKNNAINEPIIVVSTANAIVTARLVKIWLYVYLSDNLGEKNIVPRSLRKFFVAMAIFTPPKSIVSSV